MYILYIIILIGLGALLKYYSAKLLKPFFEYRISLILVLGYNAILIYSFFLLSSDNILFFFVKPILAISFTILFFIPISETQIEKQELKTTYLKLIIYFSLLNTVHFFQNNICYTTYSFVWENTGLKLGSFSMFFIINILLLTALLSSGARFLSTEHVLGLAERYSDEKRETTLEVLLKQYAIKSALLSLVILTITSLTYVYTLDIVALTVVVLYSFFLNALLTSYLAFKKREGLKMYLTEIFSKLPTKRLVIFFRLNPEGKFDLRIIILSLTTLFLEIPVLCPVLILLSLLTDQGFFISYLAFFLFLVSFLTSLSCFRQSIFESYGSNVFRLLGWNTHGKGLVNYIEYLKKGGITLLALSSAGVFIGALGACSWSLATSYVTSKEGEINAKVQDDLNDRRIKTYDKHCKNLDERAKLAGCEKNTGIYKYPAVSQPIEVENEFTFGKSIESAKTASEAFKNTAAGLAYSTKAGAYSWIKFNYQLSSAVKFKSLASDIKKEFEELAEKNPQLAEQCQKDLKEQLNKLWDKLTKGLEVGSLEDLKNLYSKSPKIEALIVKKIAETLVDTKEQQLEKQEGEDLNSSTNSNIDINIVSLDASIAKHNAFPILFHCKDGYYGTFDSYEYFQISPEDTRLKLLKHMIVNKQNFTIREYSNFVERLREQTFAELHTRPDFSKPTSDEGMKDFDSSSESESATGSEDVKSETKDHKTPTNTAQSVSNPLKRVTGCLLTKEQVESLVGDASGTTSVEQRELEEKNDREFEKMDIEIRNDTSTSRLNTIDTGTIADDFADVPDVPTHAPYIIPEAPTNTPQQTSKSFDGQEEKQKAVVDPLEAP